MISKKTILRKAFLLFLVLSLAFSFSVFTEAYESTKKDTTCKVMLVGDLMCSYGQHYAHYDGLTYDFYEEFAQIQDIFDQSDILVGNLETNISSSYPITKDMYRALDKPYLNAPFQWLDALKKAGFDGLVTANNHACDCGEIGIQETIDALDTMEIKHAGTYKSSKDDHYFIIKANGIKVGFLSYANYFNEKEDLLTEEQQSYMLGKISLEQVQKDVKALKKAGAEFIIAYNHSGIEYTHEVYSYQKKCAQILFQAGVDYMINSHSHCIQEYTTMTDGTRTMPIWYGMGNFTSTMTREISREAIITCLTLKKDSATGEVSIQEEGYYPLYQVPSYNGDYFVLLPESLGKYDNEAKSHYASIRKNVGSNERLTVYKK